MAKARAAESPVLELGVDYGGVSFGDATAKVSCSVGRRAISLAKADKTLCGRRLTGTIVAKPANWSADDQALPGLEDDIKVSGVFDVKRVGFGPKDVSFGLTFSKRDIDCGVLAEFAKRAGTLTVTQVADLDGDDTEEDGFDA